MMEENLLQRERRFYFSTFELILICLFSALVVVAKIVLRFPIRIPGHSGVFWMALLVVARSTVPKWGALSLVGLTSGLLAAFLGLGDKGAIYTFFSYLATGVVVDLCAGFLRGVETPLPAVLSGIAGNVAKMLTKAVLSACLGIPAGFLAFGLASTFATNAMSGGLGGVLGYLTLRALRAAGFFVYLAERR